MIDRILPGVYIETKAGERETGSAVSGVVAMPISMDWGATVTVINKGDDTFYRLGHSISDSKMKLVNEVLRNADRVILSRTNVGAAASAALTGSVTAKAKYGGSLGNDINVKVEAEGDKFTVSTYLDAKLVDSQVVGTAADFQPNDFVLLEGTGDLAAATVKLEGGEDSEGETGGLAAALQELEKQEFNVLAFTGTDKDEQNAVIGFVEQLRSDGVFVQAVLSGSGFNNRAIYNNTIGGKTSAYELTAAEACATMAGILAKCGSAESATNYSVDGWIDVNPHTTNKQKEDRTQNGEILFVLQYGSVVVLYDKNSLTTYTEQSPKDFGKGLIVRTLDQYASDLKRLLDTQVKGKIRNSQDGRNQIKGMISAMTTDNYSDPGYIDGFTADDITVDPGTERDSITVTVGIQIADTTDKIYVTVTAL